MKTASKPLSSKWNFLKTQLFQLIGSMRTATATTSRQPNAWRLRSQVHLRMLCRERFRCPHHPRPQGYPVFLNVKWIGDSGDEDVSTPAISFPESAILLVCAKVRNAWTLLVWEPGHRPNVHTGSSEDENGNQ